MKGTLQEVISKARYADDPKLYTVVYRDGKKFPEVPLEEFINAQDGDGEDLEIPIHRITEVKRSGQVVWRKQTSVTPLEP